MKWLVSGAIFVVAITLISLTESAQDPVRPSSPQVPPPPSPGVITPGVAPEAQRVSVVGCVQREVGGRGVAGREFILTNAALTASGSEVAGTVGNDAVVPSVSVYQLTGTNEAQMNQYVGARVEIVGVVTGGSPAGVSPGGTVPGGGSGGSSTGSGVGGGSLTGGAAGGSLGGPTGGSITGSTGGSTTGGADGSTTGVGSGAAVTVRAPLRELEITSVRAAAGTCATR